ncbi:MAG: outer membrane beta-barrel protein [Polaribacter sp.]
MKGKNLDRLFQEKLQNLEVTPNEEVWNTIESKLKNKTPIISQIWWLSAGIAAVIILGLLLFPTSQDPVLENKTITDPIIVATPKTTTDPINTKKTGIDRVSKKKKNKEEIRITKNKPIIKNTRETDIKQQQLLNTSKTLIAEKNQQDIEKGNKDLVNKKDTKKIFLANTSIKDTKIKADSISNKTNKNEIKKPKKDFLAVVKKEEKKEDTSIKKQWAVAPIFGVLNSNSFSNTSPIDKNLSESTQGSSSYSYGVQVSYQLADKWTIQSGIHLQEMGFSNNQIAVMSTNSTTSITFTSNDHYIFQNISNQNFDANSISLNSLKSFNGNLSQKYGYVEVPVEVKYHLSESKKFATQIVAGFSSLFLNKNEIDLNTGSFSRFGKATNLNNINFSGNLGFNLNYNFGKNWSLHLNPMVKIHLNTFSENGNGFRPHFIGVYTGINYNF